MCCCCAAVHWPTPHRRAARRGVVPCGRPGQRRAPARVAAVVLSRARGRGVRLALRGRHARREEEVPGGGGGPALAACLHGVQIVPRGRWRLVAVGGGRHTATVRRLVAVAFATRQRCGGWWRLVAFEVLWSFVGSECFCRAHPGTHQGVGWGDAGCGQRATRNRELPRHRATAPPRRRGDHHCTYRRPWSR